MIIVKIILALLAIWFGFWAFFRGVQSLMIGGPEDSMQFKPKITIGFPCVHFAINLVTTNIPYAGNRLPEAAFCSFAHCGTGLFVVI